MGRAIVCAALFTLLGCGSSTEGGGNSKDVGAQGGADAGSGSEGKAAGGNASAGKPGAGGASSGAGGRGTGGRGAGGDSSTSGGAGGAPEETGAGGGADGGSPGEADAGAVWCGKPRPGPTNTGVKAGVALQPSGSITIDENGALVENLDIAGQITVLANDVTIRNVRITSGDYYPIRYFDNDNTGLVIEDSEIVGTSDDVTAGLSFANYTARRMNVHGSADGFKADANVLIEDSWIHDLRNGPTQHNDGVQSTGGKGVTLRHNFISGASNAAVQTGDDGHVATEDLTVECNWLYGGGWTLNIRGQGATVPKNTVIVNNRFGRDAGYGPWTLDDPNPTIEGNVYDDDGEPIE